MPNASTVEPPPRPQRQDSTRRRVARGGSSWPWKKSSGRFSTT